MPRKKQLSKEPGAATAPATPTPSSDTAATATLEGPDDAALARAASSAVLPPEAKDISAGVAAEMPTVPVATPATTTRSQKPARAPQRPATAGVAPAEGRTWANPFQSLFVSSDNSIEMGINHRYKQFVFLFKDKPSENIRAALKEHGFVYRPAEKAWTLQESAEARVLCQHLSKVFSGQSQGMSR